MFFGFIIKSHTDDTLIATPISLWCYEYVLECIKNGSTNENVENNMIYVGY